MLKFYFVAFHYCFFLQAEFFKLNESSKNVVNKKLINKIL